VDAVRPAREIDAGYALALRQAVDAGVEVLAYGVYLDAREIVIDRSLPVIL
jgi:sugar fermentation stimulation protein A